MEFVKNAGTRRPRSGARSQMEMCPQELFFKTVANYRTGKVGKYTKLERSFIIKFRQMIGDLAGTNLASIKCNI